MTARGARTDSSSFCFAIALSPAVPGPGRAVADLDAPLDFGETTRTGGSSPQWEARQCPTHPQSAAGCEVSSATATRDTTVTAILTEPMYSRRTSTSSCEQRLIAEFCKRNRA